MRPMMSTWICYSLKRKSNLPRRLASGWREPYLLSIGNLHKNELKNLCKLLLDFLPKCGIIIIETNEREVKDMTKKEMIDVIEKSGMVINFSRSYFMGLLKSKVERFYNDAVAYMNR